MPLDDRNWVETKPEVFSLADLAAWLETQDPTTEYDYTDTLYCLVGQYTIARHAPPRVQDAVFIHSIEQGGIKAWHGTWCPGTTR